MNNTKHTLIPSLLSTRNIPDIKLADRKCLKIDDVFGLSLNHGYYLTTAISII